MLSLEIAQVKMYQESGQKAPRKAGGKRDVSLLPVTCIGAT